LKSVITDKFRKAFDKLPKDVQQKARQAYEQWKEDTGHPGLHFKQVHQQKAVYSVRVGLSHRSLGVKDNDTMVCFWIGSHEDYNGLLAQL
jgi:mRNA-degrading endonuclease RelE of RelBE toxin-antitoxin system